MIHVQIVQLMHKNCIMLKQVNRSLQTTEFFCQEFLVICKMFLQNINKFQIKYPNKTIILLANYSVTETKT
jgi:hypothetical protein